MINAPTPPRPQGGGNFFRTMAQRRIQRPGPMAQAPAGPRLPPQPPMQPNQLPAQPPPPPVFNAPPGGLPPTGGGFMAPPPSPAGQAPATPQATASSDDVSLGPNFEQQRLRRLAMAQAQAASPGRFQY